MSRPIPVDIVPSHVYLSKKDQDVLFGSGYPMTVAAELPKMGQVVYEETVEVFGSLKRSLHLRVLGPNWERSHVEITATEAAFLGVNPPEVKSGDLSGAPACRLVGPKGEVELEQGIMIPRPHLLASVEEASSLHLVNGSEVAVDILGKSTQTLEQVIVRVHPTFRLRIEINQDYARDLWLTRPVHANIRT